MERPVIVVDADKEQSQELWHALERDNYRAIALHSLGHLEEKLRRRNA
jgi:hypothetical protein